MQQKDIAAEIDKVTKTLGGKVGIYSLHIETGKSFSLNGEDRFPMASTDKIPLIAYCLLLADQKHISLDEQMSIYPYDLRSGTGLLSKRFDIPGVILTIRNLIRLSLEVSDNTAFDILLKMVGGAAAVTEWLKSIGILDVEVSRSCLKAFADQSGIANLPEDEKCTLEQYQALENAVDIETKKHAEEKFLDDFQDTATPIAMGILLEKIFSQKILSQSSSEYMIDCMRRCQTGYTRICGMLPPDTKVAHKSGTIYGVTNDVGIIELPNNLGNLMVAVFVKSTSTSVVEKEKGIAQIARILYDYFLFSDHHG